jgi:hypothetical protein
MALVSQVLTGKHQEGTPENRRLRTNERSNILVYMTGILFLSFLSFPFLSNCLILIRLLPISRLFSFFLFFLFSFVIGLLSSAPTATYITYLIADSTQLH